MAQSASRFALAFYVICRCMTSSCSLQEHSKPLEVSPVAHDTGAAQQQALDLRKAAGPYCLHELVRHCRTTAAGRPHALLVPQASPIHPLNPPPPRHLRPAPTLPGSMKTLTRGRPVRTRGSGDSLASGKGARLWSREAVGADRIGSGREEKHLRSTPIEGLAYPQAALSVVCLLTHQQACWQPLRAVATPSWRVARRHQGCKNAGIRGTAVSRTRVERCRGRGDHRAAPA